MNSVNLIGNLTRDPELRATNSETKIAAIRVAVQRPKRNGEDRGADFIDVTAFGRLAEVCGQYLTKGRPVSVSGRLHHREWETDDGSRRQRLEVIADQIDFLGSKRDQQPQTDEEYADRIAAEADYDQVVA